MRHTRLLIGLLSWLLPAVCAAQEWVDSPTAIEEKIGAPAILYESAVAKTDNSFIEMAHRGAEQARKELGIKFTDYTLGVSEDREKKLQAIADTEPSMIIAVGFENVGPVMRLAPRYPTTHFVIIDGMVPTSIPNVQAVIFKDHEGAFLVGMLAALKTKTGTLGFVGGMDVPLIRNFQSGYEQGVHYVNKDIKILSAMVGEDRGAWSNPARAAALAKDQFDKGADIVFAAAGGSSIGVLSAAKDMKKYAIGIDTNQNALYPGAVLTSLVKRVDLAVLGTLRSSRNTHWEPGTQYLSAADGYLDYAIDRNNRTLITKDMIDHIEGAKDLIQRGLLTVTPYAAR